MATAPRRHIKVIKIVRKRFLPEGLKMRINVNRRIEIVRLAVRSILYKSNLLIRLNFYQ